ncbi:hypothetical protein T4B_588 [Trichinella pseudospiralis]|uniref:Uncharacterized protein n=1 Tax=Trichinella pseudospiralis TaxID=6337 RepID=A0A0V1GJJ9_TRIPS|nr:hypothetical protein T4B_588 [Trichinella pseudospiralis]
MENKNSNKEKKNLRCKVFKPIRNYPYPRLTELGPLGNRIYRMSSSTVLLRVVLDLLRVVRVFTFSFLHCPYLYVC